MIVFDGYLTGESKKFFINKYLNNGGKFIAVLLSLTIPIWLYLSLQLCGDDWFVPIVSLLILIQNAPYIWLKCPNGMGSWEFFDYLLNEIQPVPSLHGK